MSDRALVLGGATCVLVAAVSVAQASPPPEPPPDGQIIAVDPYPPPPPPDPEPYGLPPSPPEAPVPGESVVMLVSGAQAWLSDGAGLEAMGQGAALSMTFLERHGDFPTGFDISALFLHGDRASAYDLTMRIIGSPKIGRRKVVPFASFGVVAGASRLEAMDAKPGDPAAHGWAIGPSAAVGLHGFVGNGMYWRAAGGFLGTGVGAITADLGIGFVID